MRLLRYHSAVVAVSLLVAGVAYEDAGIPKDVTFIIGELAGDSGTVAIANNDYTSHTSTYVDQQPNAQPPF